MDIEKLFELIMKNPDNISIQYSNINGEEELIVNGENLTKENFDDSEIKSVIKEFKDRLELLDSCTFCDIAESYNDEYNNLKEMNNLLDKESFTKDETFTVLDFIDNYSEHVKEIIDDKIENLSNIKDRF